MNEPSPQDLQYMIDRLLAAGWITEGAFTGDADSFAVKWTPSGHRKARQLFELLEEFGVDARAKDFTLFRAFMRGSEKPPETGGR
jgi:hypothetical protein